MEILTDELNNRVVVICRSDESSWRPNGIKGAAIESYSIGIDPITRKIRSDRKPESCLQSFSPVSYTHLRAHET